MTDLEKLKNLTDLVSAHAYNYYVLDNPLISDAEYDKLYDEMRELEKRLNIVLENSVTNKVGGEPVKKFNSHTHLEKLYSLDKAKNVEELHAWKKRVLKDLEVVFSLEYKFDGLTLILTYENGKFICAATRGNGNIGEEVTEQVKTINSVPLNIEYKGKLEVCGEGIMKLSDLKKYNESAAEPLKNARNGVAGAIRNLDPKIAKERNLDIIFYSVNYIEENILKSQIDAIEFLKRNKFKTSS
ncbi:MAG: NAD-dependent DNA ligase LigA, partial [Firmicutes bacterium]|nr:NAD-dependent DNA ligase LigA [Bacillota bacterium]